MTKAYTLAFYVNSKTLYTLYKVFGELVEPNRRHQRLKGQSWADRGQARQCEIIESLKPLDTLNGVKGLKLDRGWLDNVN